MKNRFLLPLACGAALSLLIVSGLSCIGFVSYGDSPTTAHGLPATVLEYNSYITPSCPWVQGALQDIFGDFPYEFWQADFDDIRDWVASSIDYKPDEYRWDGDYWQTPEETLSYGTGDCEDFAILLCSLLRAYGIDAERVYVALGVNDAEGEHAFLLEDWYHDGEWRRIESQASSSSQYPDSKLDEYEITAAFNDIYYYDESFPWEG